MIIDTVLTPAEIDLLPNANLAGTLCIVFDVLRATSSIITALANGAEEIRPVLSIEEALTTREEWPDAILGGERFGNRIDGFDLGNSPLEYCRSGLRRIATTTTNGTVALRACAAADQVIAGALLNMGALVQHVCVSAPKRVLLVCAGTFRELALEDVIAAGMLASEFSGAELTDTTQVAIAAYNQHAADLLGGLRQSKNGMRLVADGRSADVDWSAQVSKFPVMGVMCGGVIRPG